MVLIRQDSTSNFDVEFNFGAILHASDGYSEAVPNNGCTENSADCRIGVGFASYTAASGGSPESADGCER